MQKVIVFFSKPENLFVLTLLIGLFTGTYKVVSKVSNHNNSLYQRVSSPIWQRPAFWMTRETRLRVPNPAWR